MVIILLYFIFTYIYKINILNISGRYLLAFVYVLLEYTVVNYFMKFSLLFYIVYIYKKMAYLCVI